MPVLPNPKHERFAQELAKGTTATKAYVLAGYKEHDGNSTTLRGNQRILDRVLEIQSRVAQRVEVTIESLIAEAEECRAAAMEAKQFSAVIAAVKEKGVLSGVRVEKSERRNLNDAERLSDDELDAAISAAVAREQAASENSLQLN